MSAVDDVVYAELAERKAEIKRQRIEINRLRANAKQDAKQIGELQFVLNELLLCEIDDAAETIVRRALEQKP